jgi:hypothetical protein
VSRFISVSINRTGWEGPEEKAILEFIRLHISIHAQLYPLLEIEFSFIPLIINPLPASRLYDVVSAKWGPKLEIALPSITTRKGGFGPNRFASNKIRVSRRPLSINLNV